MQVRILVSCLLITFTNLLFAQVPTITSSAPLEAPIGTSVSVTGTDFGGLLGISLSGTALQTTEYVLYDATFLVFTIPAVALGTYDLSLETTAGGSNLWPITIVSAPILVAKPTVTGAQPLTAEVDDYITLSGTSFYTITGVYVNGILLDSSKYDVGSSSELILQIPILAAAGTVQIRLANSAGLSPVYTYSVSGLNKPIISTINPATVRVGDRITITGLNFTTITGILIGNTIAPLTTAGVLANNTFDILVPEVPLGSQFVTVFTERGSSNDYGITVNPAPPQIVSLSDTILTVAEQFTISGRNFAAISAVVIGIDTITSYAVASTQQIVVTIPFGGMEGAVSVISAYGIATSTQTITVDSNTNTVQSVLMLVDQNTYKIAPNPFTNTLTISVPAGSVLYDSISLQQLDGTNFNVPYVVEGTHAQLHTENLSPGIYFLKLDRVYRVVKQ